MAELRANQLFAGGFTTSGYHDLYTVPTGHRIILKRVTAVNLSGSSGRFAILIDSSPVLLDRTLAAYGSVGDGVDVGTWVVVGTGQKLRAYMWTNFSLHLALSGSYHYI